MNLRSFSRLSRRTLFWLEHVLALAVLGGTIAFGVLGTAELFHADWSQLGTYVLFLEQMLFVAIGVELARLLISYSLDTLVELLAFVIARKLLLLEHDFVGLIMGISALAILFASRHYFPRAFEDDDSSSTPGRS